MPQNSKEKNCVQTCQQTKNAFLDYNSLKVRKLPCILPTLDYVNIKLIVISLFTTTFILIGGRSVMLDLNAPCDLLLDSKGYWVGGTHRIDTQIPLRH
jgi:hypothetical protein